VTVNEWVKKINSCENIILKKEDEFYNEFLIYQGKICHLSGSLLEKEVEFITIQIIEKTPYFSLTIR
jgi:hypothetical protein